MPHLIKLKLSDKTRTDVETNPEDLLRNKLIARLLEQKELVEADLKGEQLTKTRFKFVTDSETGESKRVEPGFPRWITDLMTCFADSAIRINAIPSALRANPMPPSG